MKANGALTKVGLACLMVSCATVTWAKPTARAVFVRDNEIWIVNRNGSGLKQLTKDARPKHHPVWSPDASKVAYHLDFDRSGNAEIVIIGVASGEIVNVLPLPGASSAGVPEINAILRMEWLSSDRLGYEGHVNPSLSEYRVVNLSSGKIIKTLPGARFQWSPDRKKFATLGWLPHFNAPETLHQFIRINGRTVYTLPNGRLVDYVASDFSWSADSTKVAFLERDESLNLIKLVILTTGGRITTAILSPTTDVTLGIAWLSNDAVAVKGDNSVWTYSYARRKLARLSPRLKRSFDQYVRQAQSREALIASLNGNEASWWP